VPQVLGKSLARRPGPGRLLSQTSHIVHPGIDNSDSNTSRSKHAPTPENHGWAAGPRLDAGSPALKSKVQFMGAQPHPKPGVAPPRRSASAAVSGSDARLLSPRGAPKPPAHRHHCGTATPGTSLAATGRQRQLQGSCGPAKGVAATRHGRRACRRVARMQTHADTQTTHRRSSRSHSALPSLANQLQCGRHTGGASAATPCCRAHPGVAWPGLGAHLHAHASWLSPDAATGSRAAGPAAAAALPPAGLSEGCLACVPCRPGAPLSVCPLGPCRSGAPLAVCPSGS
jgi:hypothetical protein